MTTFVERPEAAPRRNKSMLWGGPDPGVFNRAKPSSPGSRLLQEQPVGGEATAVRVARLAAGWDAAGHGNVGLVAGATSPQQLALIRAAAPELPILAPAIGAQCGDV